MLSVIIYREKDFLYQSTLTKSLYWRISLNFFRSKIFFINLKSIKFVDRHKHVDNDQKNQRICVLVILS